jgi:hypothetical protein
LSPLQNPIGECCERNNRSLLTEAHKKQVNTFCGKNAEPLHVRTVVNKVTDMVYYI